MAEKIVAPTSAGSNLSPTHFLELYRDLAIAQREIDSATGRKRAILKRAKSSGVDLDALALLGRLLKIEPDESAHLIRTTFRYATWLEAPIGSQRDLFGPDDDQRPTDKARADNLEFMAETDGYNAGLRGDDIDTNPKLAGAPTFDLWRQGWHSGQAALASKLAVAGDDDGKSATVTKLQTGRRKKGAEQRTH